MNVIEPWLHSPKATADIIKKYGFRFKKNFGQNFLIDPNIIKKILEASDIKKDDLVLEIGPGIGTLTQHIAYSCGHVIAVEIDKSLIPVLEETLSGYENVTLINDDILNIDISKLIREKGNGRPAKIIANLPYYITTPVVMKILEENRLISSMTIMVQKEVAERMSAEAGTKNYGALSLAVRYHADTKKVTDVSPNCFMPRPDVSSIVIQLDIKRKTPAVSDEKLMFGLIRAAFMQRRKTLINSLKNSALFSLNRQEWESALKAACVPQSVRGETLTLEDFARLSEEVRKYLKK